MSNLVKRVREKLLANSAVSALVGTRIYPQVAPQGAGAPYLVLTVISDVPENTANGRVGELTRNARLQVDAYSERYEQANELAEAANLVIAGLTGTDLSGLRLSQLDLYEDDSPRHRVSADYSIWF